MTLANEIEKIETNILLRISNTKKIASLLLIHDIKTIEYINQLRIKQLMKLLQKRFDSFIITEKINGFLDQHCEKSDSNIIIGTNLTDIRFVKSCNNKWNLKYNIIPIIFKNNEIEKQLIKITEIKIDMIRIDEILSVLSKNDFKNTILTDIASY